MTDRVHVLIIDDRVGVRLTLRNILFGLDCDFTEATSGEDALAILASQKFDVTFLDLSLADLSGLDILEQSVSRGEAMGNVIVLTGLPEEATRLRAESLGVFAYLSKDPIDRTAVRETFARATNTPPSSSVDASPIPAPVKRAPRRTAAVSKRESVSRPKILVLDDKEYWVETIERLLNDEFDIVGSSSADDAYEKVKRGQFVLVIIDMKLPGDETGLDVLSRMRQARPDLRAIILTEYPDWIDAVESWRRGAIDYVSKADVTSLKSVVTRILQDRPTVHVFLSYDRRDKARVLQLYQRLMTRGFIPWMDVKNLIPGQRYDAHTKNAIKSSDHFLFCVTHNSLEKKDGLLQKEMRIALDLEQEKRSGANFLIPVRLEPCENHPDLTEFQAVDLFQRDGFGTLLKALSPNNGKKSR